MRRMLDEAIYYATMPVRLFGRSHWFRLAFGAACVAAGFFAATLWALDRFLPADSGVETALAIMNPPPPLQAITRSSYVIAPIAVALSAIRSKLDAGAPRELAGKNDNPVSSLLSKADIGLTVARGTLTVSGAPNELAIATPLNGTLRVTGQIATTAGNLTSSITSLLDSSIGKDVGKLTGKVLDQRAEVRGNVTVRAKPALTANWRLEPNLTAQVALADSAVTLAGLKVNVSSEAKPLIDREVNAQIASLQTRLRNDPFIERAARAQWTKMCRSIPLGGDKTGLPRLWLEMRPIRAAAAQPQIDGRNVTLTIGVQADTRITPQQSKPDCPFPAQLELVPPMDNGKLAVGVPIDVPFSELDKLLEAQLKGRHFPEDGSAPVDIEVRRASIAAAGDRLLISLRVKAREKKSWFGFGARSDRADLGQAGARSQEPDSPPHRSVGGGGIGSRFRLARRRRARRHALSTAGAGRQRGSGFEAVRRRRADQNRHGARRIPAEQGRRAGRGRGARLAPHRHRIRLQAPCA